MNLRPVLVAALIAVVPAFTACQTVYNTTLEKVFGYEKRELLKKAVTNLRTEQEQAREEFKDAMTRLKELYAFQGGELEAVYGRLKASYDDATSQAQTVAKRIDSMEDISGSMFAEWEKEIAEFSNPTFAENSRRQLRETKERYAQMLRSVRAAESSMKPVLTQLKDHVLYLKHNLNAAAIGSLKGEAGSIETQIERLIGQMNGSITEADAFLQTLPK